MLQLSFYAIISLPVTHQDCYSLNFIQTLLWHISFVTFDIFILYKSFIVVDKNKLYLALASMVLLYRIGWSIVGLIKSGGYWDDAEQACNYHQDSSSGFQYTLTDILCDLLATIASVVMLCKPENRLLTFESLWLLLVKENALRSFITLIINAVQNYCFIRLLNLELYYKAHREEKLAESLRLSASSRNSVADRPSAPERHSQTTRKG
ncbi:hypothetical protein BCR33DRAFT_717398 [Rhizoclosmatium globosum]|uniref:Uncharacterized protein n=1 Tax=Rhizoclosmatium globosum TaxID=329046 RepID=A0A1Y2C9N4_9FUNG|nr:hypothetical protein BCR33DRAFT_717398 [Rhizoclosmatium globosum]|eukprot:ORY43748.1 hypothetical protein BCR33DRAFT_717398 [Rhizoclosmatium globosum]